MADLYIIGQILSASNFVEPNLFCKWSIQVGNNWTVVEGITEGHTITDSSRVIDQESILIHPLDIHLTCRGVQVGCNLLPNVCHINPAVISSSSRAGQSCTLKFGQRTVWTSAGQLDTAWLTYPVKQDRIN